MMDIEIILITTKLNTFYIMTLSLRGGNKICTQAQKNKLNYFIQHYAQWVFCRSVCENTKEVLLK